VGASHTPGLVVVGAVLWLIGGRGGPGDPSLPCRLMLTLFSFSARGAGWDGMREASRHPRCE
jgi:hypothetical protein